MPRSFIACSQSFGGADSRVNILLSDVPALSALIPAFAINPIATAVSSIEYPRAPTIGAAYWNVCPIIPTLVFAFELAAAITSASLPASPAL